MVAAPQHPLPRERFWLGDRRKEKRKKIGGVGVDGPGGVTGEEIGDILLLCICICIVTSSKF